MSGESGGLATTEGSGAGLLEAEAPAVKLDVLGDHLGYLIRRAQLWIFQDFTRTLSSIDLTTAEYSVLVVVGANPGLSQSNVATTLGIERARFVRLLDDLERRGAAERRAAPKDRRTHAIYLTRAGSSLLRRAKLLAAEHEKQVEKKVGVSARIHLVRLLKPFSEG